MDQKSDTDKVLMAVGALMAVAWISEKFRDDTFDDFVPAPVDPTVPNLSAQALTIMADILEQALLGGSFTEDEQTVYGQFDQLTNDADLYALIETFGTRCQYFGMFNCGTLPQVMIYYLDHDELFIINSILQENGLSYRFATE